MLDLPTQVNLPQCKEPLVPGHSLSWPKEWRFSHTWSVSASLVSSLRQSPPN